MSRPIVYVAYEMAHYGRVACALTEAGWIIYAHDGSPLSLIVHDIEHAMPMGDGTADIPCITIREAGLIHDHHADLEIPASEPDTALVARFAQWLPPSADELDRLAQAFGRASLAPLVERLRDELRAAVVLLDSGGRPDAHKLAGVAGTVGFAAASDAWRRLDEVDGPTGDARRETRKAIVTINHWLAAAN